MNLKRSWQSLALLFLLTVLPSALQAQENSAYLDVTVNLFEHQAPVADEESINHDLIAAEERYIPVMLSLYLQESGLWGAVRVSPVPDLSAGLSITGQILHSDHSRLALHIRAQDSSGRIWLDQTYESTATESVSLMGNVLNEDPFFSVYSGIAYDLAGELALLNDGQRDNLVQLALLRYAASLAGSAFNDYVAENEAGLYEIARLPADDDPMLQRIEAIREREYLFIDVVHEQLLRFFVDIKPLYDLWRSAQEEQAELNSRYVSQQARTDNDFTPGSYYDLREQYEQYRWARISEQYEDELSRGFSNEARPTEIALEESLFSLQGTLEEQYRQWRTILAELYELETALP